MQIMQVYISLGIPLMTPLHFITEIYQHLKICYNRADCLAVRPILCNFTVKLRLIRYDT